MMESRSWSRLDWCIVSTSYAQHISCDIAMTKIYPQRIMLKDLIDLL